MIDFFSIGRLLLQCNPRCISAWDGPDKAVSFNLFSKMIAAMTARTVAGGYVESIFANSDQTDFSLRLADALHCRSDLGRARRHHTTVGRIGWFDEKRAADTPNSGHSLERHTRPLWVITSHYAKAIDEEIERRRDASPARQKSNRTSCLEMLDY